MKFPAIFRRRLLLASGLIIIHGAAWADIAPSPFRPQADNPHFVEPTAQAHLDAVARDVQSALDFTHAPDYMRPEDNLLVIRYGGFFQKAQDDLNVTLADIAAATTFLKAHPEANPLAAGPVPASDLKAPLLPTMYQPSYGLPWLLRILDNLDMARDALVNNPAKDYRGSILGDIGGFRAKILGDIGQVGADLVAGILYDRNAHGTGTGLISFSTPTLTPDPIHGPTAHTHLQAVEHNLKLLNLQMSSAGQSFRGGRRGAPDNVDATQGGYVAKVTADMDKTLADVAQAQDYLREHPEANPLKAGPAEPEVSKAQPMVVPAYAIIDRSHATLVGFKLNANAMDALNAALELLLNNPSAEYRGVVLGDLGGFRARIMDDINQTALDTLAGMDFSLKEISGGANLPPNPVSPVLPQRQVAPTAQAHVEAAQRSLRQALASLRPEVGRYASIPPFGGFIEKTAGDLNKALADAQDALAYVVAHPEVDALPVESATLEKIKAPGLPLLASRANRTSLAESVVALDAACQVLLNNSPAVSPPAALGDLGGFRAKILDDLGRAGADLNAAVDYYNAHGDDQGVIPIPSAAAPTAEANGHSLVPTAIAGIALSLAFSLGGIHFSSRKHLFRNHS